MNKIKLRETVKDIKTLDKSKTISKHINAAIIRTKEHINHEHISDNHSPENYASDQAISKSKDISAKVSNQTLRHTATVAKYTRHKYHGHKTSIPAREAPQPIKTYTRADIRTLKPGTKKAAIKTPQRSIKTAERVAKTNVKAAQYSAKAGIKAARYSASRTRKTTWATTKTTKSAVRASKATAKTTSKIIKTAIKVLSSTVKTAITGAKALVSALIAGGWVAVLIILIICLIGWLCTSVFGIFFSGEPNGNNPTMQVVVSEINTEYEDMLNKIKQSNKYDVLEMSGAKAVWKEVLAVYAVKTVTDPDIPQEVATLDNVKIAILETIFWEMNTISFQTKTKTETITETTDDGMGRMIEAQKSVTRTYLYITVNHKTAAQMAERYNWNTDQRRQLNELLKPDYDSMWAAVLYGVSEGNTNIVEVAISQIGNIGGQPYWSWYGFNSRVAWCACFVSWCAEQCGYIEAGIIPRFAACQSQGIPWFKSRGQWQDNSYVPKAGDIIFFDWQNDGHSDHVGIVEKTQDGMVHTVEGNSSNMCRRRKYAVGSRNIVGYGIPKY